MSDYGKRREQLIDALSPEERKVFDEAYAAAGRAMERVEAVFAAKAHREALALRDADRSGDDTEFVEAISDVIGDE